MKCFFFEFSIVEKLILFHRKQETVQILELATELLSKSNVKGNTLKEDMGKFLKIYDSRLK